jgi:hypothetical protein
VGYTVKPGKTKINNRRFHESCAIDTQYLT